MRIVGPAKLVTVDCTGISLAEKCQNIEIKVSNSPLRKRSHQSTITVVEILVSFNGRFSSGAM